MLSILQMVCGKLKMQSIHNESYEYKNTEASIKIQFNLRKNKIEGP